MPSQPGSLDDCDLRPAARGMAACISMNTLGYHYIPIDAPPPPASVLEDAIAFAAGDRMRLRGVDLEDRLFASTEPHYLASVSACAARHGVELLSLGVKVDFSIVPTAATVCEEVARAEDWIDAAAALGVPLLRLPGNGAQPTEASRAATLRLVVEKMRAVVQYGATRGVAVGLHNHNHGAVPSTGDEVLLVLDAVPVSVHAAAIRAEHLCLKGSTTQPSPFCCTSPLCECTCVPCARVCG